MLTHCRTTHVMVMMMHTLEMQLTFLVRWQKPKNETRHVRTYIAVRKNRFGTHSEDANSKQVSPSTKRKVKHVAILVTYATKV